MDRETVRPGTFLYPFQVTYGVLMGIAGLTLYRRWQAGEFGLPAVLALIGAIAITLVFVAYLQNLHKRASVLRPDYSRKCYNCRLPVNRYSEFCEHCGADQVERTKVRGCPSCDTEVYQGVAYCPGCGQDLRNKKLKKLRY